MAEADNNEEDELDNIPPDMKTKAGYLKDGFGLEPKKWAVWSNGLISSGGIDFNVNQLGRRNESNGFINIDFISIFFL